MLFEDRADAGRRLGEKLAAYTGRPDLLVLGLPRGGMPVAFEVAEVLGASLDLFVVRKLRVPGHQELAMGAIATGGVRVLNRDVVQALSLSDETIEAIAARERRLLERRERMYRGDRPAADVRGRIAILVDDGMASGSTMLAAVAALRTRGPEQIVVAVPVAAPSTYDEFKEEVDEIVCVARPEPFYAVGIWYRNFSQTSDQEVRELLARSSTSLPAR